ncbi:sugar transferase, partial [Pseudorhizobium marinum]
MSLKRTLDLAFTIPVLLLMALPMVILALAVRATSSGPAVYWSKRIGRDN